MRWTDAQLALLLLSEERVGRPIREEAALEDAQFEQAKQALRG
jgi:hypothetical protein